MSIRISSTLLMYKAMQSCRHLMWEPNVILPLLSEVLAQVRATDNFIVEVTDERIAELADYHRDDLLGELKMATIAFSTLPPLGHDLFNLMELGCADALRLWEAQSLLSLKRLGYGLHNIPWLILTSEEFDRKDFGFCFRIICGCWSELSVAFREILCEVMQLSLGDVETLIHQEKFVVPWA